MCRGFKSLLRYHFPRLLQRLSADGDWGDVSDPYHLLYIGAHDPFCSANCGKELLARARRQFSVLSCTWVAKTL